MCTTRTGKIRILIFCCTFFRYRIRIIFEYNMKRKKQNQRKFHFEFRRFRNYVQCAHSRWIDNERYSSDWIYNSQRSIASVWLVQPTELSNSWICLEWKQLFDVFWVAEAKCETSALHWIFKCWYWIVYWKSSQKRQLGSSNWKMFLSNFCLFGFSSSTSKYYQMELSKIVVLATPPRHISKKVAKNKINAVPLELQRSKKHRIKLTLCSWKDEERLP